MIRKSTHTIQEIENLIKDDVILKIDDNSRELSKDRFVLDGDVIKKHSDRYRTFFTKGYQCSCCGISGVLFAKEKNNNCKQYHLNLYAIDDSGNEILMTKDHILPKSKGGLNHIKNYQTMCVRCNFEKGSEILKRLDKTAKVCYNKENNN